MASFRQLILAWENWETDSLVRSGGRLGAKEGVATEGSQSKKEADQLVRTIEGEIIPRLVLAHRARIEAPSGPDGDEAVPDAEDVAELARLVLAQDEVVASSYVEALQMQGASQEALLLNLLAPTARHLGDLWVADLCDFTEVTIGLGRLQRLLRHLSRASRLDLEQLGKGRRALLSATPGEQHTFGILMVAEFLRSAGWDVCGEPGLSRADLVGIVSGEWFGLLGLSLCGERHLDELALTIRAVRRASKNPAIGVMVGGAVFVDQPELVSQVGADATALDGLQAALQADHLLALLPTRC